MCAEISVCMCWMNVCRDTCVHAYGKDESIYCIVGIFAGQNFHGWLQKLKFLDKIFVDVGLPFRTGTQLCLIRGFYFHRY